MICQDCGDTVVECRCDHLAIPQYKEHHTQICIGGEMYDMVNRITPQSEVWYIRLEHGRIVWGSSRHEALMNALQVLWN